MGPLVPEIFNQEFNYVIALLLGLFFGFILEQAGFSSSRKLAGLFYGYDFVVLRVFFTAGVTAMIGVVLLGNLGYLDLDLIFINPTFLWSAIVGGAIMGVGFILGGYCPGTGIAAASIGKLDAIVFFVGIVLGVFLFGEIYPSIDWLYTGYNWGDLRIFDAMGISPGLFVFGMILMAFGAFIFTTIIENKVNKTNIGKPAFSLSRPEFKFVYFAAIYVVFGFILLAMPSHKDKLWSKLNDQSITKNYKINDISATELAFRLLDEDMSIQLVDLQQGKYFAKNHLPGAANLEFEKLFTKEGSDLINKSKKNIVFYDYNGELAAKAAVLAMMNGNKRVMALKGGLKNFNKEITQISTKPGTDPLNTLAESKFKQNISERLAMLSKKLENKAKPASSGAKRSKGGC